MLTDNEIAEQEKEQYPYTVGQPAFVNHGVSDERAAFMQGVKWALETYAAQVKPTPLTGRYYQWVKIETANDLPKIRGEYITKLTSGAITQNSFHQLGSVESSLWMALISEYLEECTPLDKEAEIARNAWNAATEWYADLPGANPDMETYLNSLKGE